MPNFVKPTHPSAWPVQARRLAMLASLASLAALLPACGGGGGGGGDSPPAPPAPPAPPTGFSLGGTVTGVLAGQTVTISGATRLTTATADGAFELGRDIPSGTQYTVTAGSPAANQRCLVTDGARGTITGNVSSIRVDCSYRQPWSLIGVPKASALSEDGSQLIVAGALRYATPLQDLQFRLDTDTGRARGGSLTQAVFLNDTARPDGAGGAYLTQQLAAPIEFFDPDTNYAIRRLDANGNPTSFRADGLRARANARVGERLFLAGSFTVAGSSAPTGLMAVDATTGARVTWSTDMRGEGIDLLARGNTLFVQRRLVDPSGGVGFTLAAVDAATGVTRDWAPRFTGSGGFPISVDPMKMVISGRTLVVTGNFVAVDGLRRANVAAFDTETLLLRAWPANPVTTDFSSQPAVAATADRVFLTSGIEPPDGISRWVYAVSTDTGELLPWNSPVLSTAGSSLVLYGLVIQGDQLLLHGEFQAVNDQARRGLAAVAISDGRLLPFAADAQLDRGPGGLFVSGSQIWVWGGARGGGVGAQELTGFDTRSGMPTVFSVDVRGTAESPVSQLLRVGSTLIVAGSFSEVAGVPRRNLAAIDARTGAVLDWNPNLDGGLRSMVRQGNRIYFLGDFTRWDGQPRPGVARVDASSLLADDFGSAAGFLVGRGDSLAESGGRLYIALGNQFAAVDAATGTREFWRTALATVDFSFTAGIAVRDGFVHAAGSNYLIPGVAEIRNTVKLDAATGAPQAWLAVNDTRGTVQKLFQIDNTILVSACRISPLSVRTCDLGADSVVSGVSSYSLLFSDVLPVADVQADANTWYLVGEFGMTATQPSGLRFVTR
jgi:hypothetical protein